MNAQQRAEIEHGSRTNCLGFMVALLLSAIAIAVIAVISYLALTSMLGPAEIEVVDWPLVTRTADGTITTPMPEDLDRLSVNDE
jgi:hypothetical protein